MSKNLLPICVVGSGLSGISAAKALIQNGHKVVMIDPGLDLPTQTVEDVKKISQKSVYKWDEDDHATITAGVESSTSGVKEKLFFGSNFSSHNLDCFSLVKKQTKFYMSFAKAGLGNIWGAGLLPMHSEDMVDWPITSDELQTHYKSVLEFMPVSARYDRLSNLFPLEGSPSYHAPSRQASRMLAKMEKNADLLEKHGLHFGASRLAGCFHGRNGGYECQYCGKCLYGCPYGVIYTGRETLEELMKEPNFVYKPGMVVQEVRQDNNSVKLLGTDVNGKPVEPLPAKRVLLACGPFSTAKIVLSSLDCFDKEIQVKTTDQYYMPFMTMAGQPDLTTESLHSMCQAFWVLKNRDVSPYMIHSSIYTYNDLYAKAVKSILGKMDKLLWPLAMIPLSRMYFTITYLHSKHSAVLRTKLVNNASKTLQVTGKVNPQSRQVFKAAKKQWAKLSTKTGLYPVPFYPGEKLPGAGNHSGGGFPMCRRPKGLQTDVLGRIPDLDRVHIVDSSVFPSITATTITYTIMANAHRIATGIANLDEASN